MTDRDTDIIDIDDAKTLSGLFLRRVQRTPSKVAYRYFDTASRLWCELTWDEMSRYVARWQSALVDDGFKAGDRVALMLPNGREWIAFEQAALGLGLVVIPLYVNDRPDNVGYILSNAGAKALLLQGAEQWQALQLIRPTLNNLIRVVSVAGLTDASGANLRNLDDWLPSHGDPLYEQNFDPHQLATIVYTSGTTGRPKGVMLSHHNILWNAFSAMQSVACYLDDVFLSFLPLSHTLERTAGYYLPMMAGAEVAFARSIPHMPEDLITIRPTVLISVPRIFERVALKVQATLNDKGGIAPVLFSTAVSVGWRHFLHQQHRGPWHPALAAWPLLKKLVAEKILTKFGGRIRVAVCGGAPLSPQVAKIFLGLGLPLVQGYGMTETSPVISVNRLDRNDPASVGEPLADVETKIADNGELLVRGPGVMLGYWDNDVATKDAIDGEGWLHTGDKAQIRDNHIYITGRLKEIIVLANGEKIPPSDMEAAIVMDSLFEQAMIVGEGKSYLCALVVLNGEQWTKEMAAFREACDPKEALTRPLLVEAMTKRIGKCLHDFPGYAQVRRVMLCLEPWSVENELLTPTLKLKRAKILARYEKDIEQLYHGH